ncbi:MAG: YggS family pyridoxal phosphate-dependent enzyme [Deltaproteobacteria bacterium]|nr:YggS family pyridoxal phosphate-dependent enzyme [Deltaproteobacteria bacterium]
MKGAETSLSSEEASSRLAAVQKEITLAAVKAGRAPEDITLLAVSKTFPMESVEAFISAGQRDFGESYIQEAREKIPNVKGKAHWHFIGHLQTNKAKYAVKLFSVLHALDSLELALELNKRLVPLDAKIEAYVQVNVSGEGTKSGLEPEELSSFLDSLASYPAVVPVGLMTMPPYDPDPEVSRPFFRKLYELKEKCAPSLKGLSMGMSGDFPVAIEEGATIVRVGTSLFGARNYA